MFVDIHCCYRHFGAVKLTLFTASRLGDSDASQPDFLTDIFVCVVLVFSVVFHIKIQLLFFFLSFVVSFSVATRS